MYNNLSTSLQNRILTITINRESKLNALNRETLSDLHFSVSEALADEKVGGIIITGAGKKAFVAGADIAEFASFSVIEGQKLAKEGQAKVFDLIENASKPVIAAIIIHYVTVCYQIVASSNSHYYPLHTQRAPDLKL